MGRYPTGYDNGGVIAPGMTIVHNDTGAPQPMFPAAPFQRRPSDLLDTCGTLVAQQKDGVVTIVEADRPDRIACAVSLLSNPDLHDWVIRPDGLLQFDTAGEYVYRIAGASGSDTLICERVR